MERSFRSAIEAIQRGLKDCRANDPKRASSAVGNSYAGALLLEKEVLTSAAPNANLQDVIGPDKVRAAKTFIGVK